MGRLLIDITNLVYSSVRTGVHRITRGLLRGLFELDKFCVVPVALTNIDDFCEIKADVENDRYMKLNRYCPKPGDIFLGLDLNYCISLDVISYIRGLGIRSYFVVYDLIPIINPVFFPYFQQLHHQLWFNSIIHSDGLITISCSVANDVFSVLSVLGKSCNIGWIKCGYDFESVPVKFEDSDSNYEKLLSKMENSISFLMVSTVEPRKAYEQVLDAFDKLWRERDDLLLIIVGREGWSTKVFDLERFGKRVESHPLWNRNLFWLKKCDDYLLSKLYEKSSCLIFASYAEGWGLAVSEAIGKGLPVILRDIPVFREITENKGFFFKDSKSPDVIYNAVKVWLSLYSKNKISVPNIKLYSWKDSAEMLIDIIDNSRWEDNFNYISCDKISFLDFLGDSVILFGAGGGGRKLYRQLKSVGINVMFFIDNDPAKDGSTIDDIPVLHSSKVDFSSLESKIIISSMWREEITKQLESYGLKEGVDFF